MTDSSDAAMVFSGQDPACKPEAMALERWERIPAQDVRMAA